MIGLVAVFGNSWRSIMLSKELIRKLGKPYDYSYIWRMCDKKAIGDGFWGTAVVIFLEDTPASVNCRSQDDVNVKRFSEYVQKVVKGAPPDYSICPVAMKDDTSWRHGLVRFIGWREVWCDSSLLATILTRKRFGNKSPKYGLYIEKGAVKAIVVGKEDDTIVAIIAPWKQDQNWEDVKAEMEVYNYEESET